MKRTFLLLAALLASPTQAREYLKGPPAVQSRAYTPGVVTEGGRVLWLAGQTSLMDADGTSLVGNFDAQVRDVFRRLEATIARGGGRLSDMVTMTVFITDTRLGTRFTEIRREIFGDNFPASALITVVGLAQPGMLVEVQGIAVLGDR